MNECHPPAPHVQTAKLENARRPNDSLDCVVVSMHADDAGMPCGCFYTSANVKSSVCNNTIGVFSYTEQKIYKFDLIILESRLLLYNK